MTIERRGVVEVGSGSRPAIAIVGIGCRFPGGIAGPGGYWGALLSGLDAIGGVPADRYDAESLYDARPGRAGRIATQWGGFLDGIDRFDAEFFGISRREAERMDPQQRLLLEVAWEALEDGAQDPGRLAGTRTGVFVGLWLNDYEARLFADRSAVDFHATTGTGRYAAPGRISHALGLRGPSIAVDSACSSSLVAVHLACRSVWSGESEVALAGGANAILQPHITIAYSQSGMMSPRGRCRFGDAGADGYVRSEGAGMVVLKRLDRALEDGDPVHAVILGGAVNNDGAGAHFGTPARSGQEALLRDAYADAGVDACEVAYVEAHGTGTSAGDPVEIGALSAVVGAGRSAGAPCLVGSVKTNIGHTEGAAGIAGLIKAALVVEHGVVPASLHFETPTPAVDWDHSGVRIAAESTRLGVGARYAGVSSFGIAGTNAHLVLAAAPGAAGGGREAGSSRTKPAESAVEGRTEADAVLVPLSAHSAAALTGLARAVGEWLDRDDAPRVADVAWTFATRRAHHAHRRVLVVRTTAELRAGLGAPEAQPAAAAPTGRPVVFVFPGQGSQWEGMGRRLLEQEPVFRAAVEDCDAALRPHVEWSLLEQLAAEPGSAAWQLDRIDVIQPVLIALDIALAALWRSWGIEPAAVVGHSMGEVAAAHVAGALGLEDAMRVIAVRSRLLRRISGRGAMAVVELTEAEAATAVAERESQLSVAAVNSPRSTVVSGDPAALESLLAELAAREVFCRRIAVDVASHSPQVDELAEALRRELAPITPRETRIPLRSTVSGAVEAGETLGAQYWVRNLRAPVRFARVVTDIAAEATAAGGAIFLEVSPHPVLLPSIEQTLAAEGLAATATASLRRDEQERDALLRSLGEFYVAGATPEWSRVLRPARPVRLPPYPWQRERYWLSPVARVSAGGHPILGVPVRSASGALLWEGSIPRPDLERLRDHRVRGRAVLPAASILEMALSAVAELDGTFAVEELRLEGMLDLEGEPPAVQLELGPPVSGSRTLTLHARAGGDAAAEWSRHAVGRIVGGVEADGEAPVLPAAGAPGAPHYAAMADRGLDYGPEFRGVESLVESEGGVAATIRGGTAVTDATTLDAALQAALVAAAAELDPTDTLVPVSVRRLRLHGADAGRPTTAAAPSLHAYAVARRDGDPGEPRPVDLVVVDASGRTLLTAEAVRFARLPSAAPIAPALYRLQWQPLPLPSDGEPAVAAHWALAADRSGVAAMLAAELERVGHTVSICPPGELPMVGGTAHVVHLRSLDAAPGPNADADELMRAQEHGCLDVLATAQAALEAGEAPPRLWVVTCHATATAVQDGAEAPAHAGLDGLCAVLANEHPALSPVRLDLDSREAAEAARTIAAELLHGGTEPRIAWRDGQRLAARLVRTDDAAASPGAAPPGYRLATSQAGMLENLRLEAAPRRAPRAGEIEIEVHCAGLNFMNVLSALGAYPGAPGGVGPLGIECVGVVVSVGEGVSALAEGDRVMAYAHGAMASHVVCDARLAAPVPESLSFAAAATVPVAHLTAWHSLVQLARLGAGERVLIHSATGGVGLAALRIARNAGAEVYATAGSDAKRAYLRAQGVEHVFDSRSAFADHVLAASGGEGVDVVLNSLAGDAISEGLRVLRPHGRFIELGKRDIHDDAPLPLTHFRRNLSFFAVDLDRMAAERPAELGAVLTAVTQALAAGDLEPLPFETHEMIDAPAAFATMSAARHIGKLVLTTRPPTEWQADILRTSPVLERDGTWLVTGGTGALGLETARRLVERGAGALVLVGRGPATAVADAAVNELRGLGIAVRVESCDVAEEGALAAVLERADRDLPPLRGVVHAAGVLADGSVATLDRAHFLEPFAAKVRGAWALHRLTAERKLDFFVLYSSVSAVLGTAGQSNYAAANAFLDALAVHRRARGLPATSVAWGPWSQIGLAAARADRGRRLARDGLPGLAPAAAAALLDRALLGEDAHVLAMRIDAERWCANQPASSPLLTALRGDAGSVAAAAADFAQMLRSAGERAEELLAGRIRERVAGVLRVEAARVSAGSAFKRLGMDSLMGLELRNRLEVDLGMAISATAIWNYPTVERLAAHLAARIAPASPRSVQAEAASAAPTAAELEELLDSELRAAQRVLRGGE